MSTAIKKVDFQDGAVLEIFQDEYPVSPRELDNLGHIICFHKRYLLGDKHDYKETDFSSWDDLKQQIENDHDVLIILPLRLYDHSGISLSASTEYPYNCRWDSCQVGFIFVTAKEAKEWYEVDGVTEEFRQRVRENLLAELNEYDLHLRGEVYGYKLTIPKPSCSTCGHAECDEESCWGFIGNDMKKNGMIDQIPSRYQEEFGKVFG